MAWKARVRWRRLRGELEGAMADSFRSQGRHVGLRLAPCRVDAIGGGLMSDDAWQYSPNPFISFSLASCTAVPSGGLRGTMQNGENRETLPEASKSSSDMDLHIAQLL